VTRPLARAPNGAGAAGIGWAPQWRLWTCASHEREPRNAGVIEIVEISGRGHSLTIDSGWPEVV
jgi:hypothetical protein